MSGAATIPTDIGAEAVTLGSMILGGPECVGQVRAIVRASDFYRPAHWPIFTAICDLTEAGKPVDLVVLRDQLEQQGKLEAVGGMDYLSEVVDGTPSADNAEYYARIVRDKAIRRQLLKAANDLHRNAADPQIDLSDIFQAGQNGLDSARVRGNGELARPSIALRCAADIPAVPVRWLWPGRFPSGKVSLLIGHPGCGKTLLTVSLAARLSVGKAWPDGEACEVGNSILLSGEDDPEDTLVPRLKSAGANLQRVSIMEGVQYRDPDTGAIRIALPELDRDMALIRQAVEDRQARLLVIDPVSSFVGHVDDHRNAALRGLLAALAKMAADTGCAVVCISHLRKAGGLAVHQAVGSLAYTAAARAVWALVRDPQDAERRLLLPVKMNLARDASGLAFRPVASIPSGCPCLRWEDGPVKLQADDVLNPDTRPGPPAVELEEAQEWLSIQLADGPKAAAKLLADASAEGISKSTLKRAKAELCVRARKAGFDTGWIWQLPGCPGSSGQEIREGDEGASEDNLGPFGET